MPLQLILVLVVSLILVLFTFQNPHPVQMQFMAWQTHEFPLIALILVSALFGVIASSFVSLKSLMQTKQTIRDLRSEIDALSRGEIKPGELKELETEDETDMGEIN